MDYLENYKTGVDRLNIMNRLNNNSNYDNENNEANPSALAGTKTTPMAKNNVGPLLYLDTNQNQKQSTNYNQCRYENDVSSVLYLI